MKRFVVILNEKAGSAADGDADRTASIRSHFAEAGVSADVRGVAADAIEAALRTAIAEQPDAIVIGGGDGTVRTGAAALVNSGVPLGVLPLGTLNHFAKDLGMPSDLREAVQALVGASPRPLDVGEVNGHVFINNCSLGSYAEAVRRREELRAIHGHGKWWAMCCAVGRTFLRLRRLRLRIAVENETPRLVRVPFIFVANNRYSGRLLHRNLRERLDEGRLWLYVAHAHRHLTILRMFLQALRRRIDDTDSLEALPATEVTIEGHGPIPAAADGELIALQSPLRFRIRPGALRVLTPARP